jgi:hypothetical protein
MDGTASAAIAAAASLIGVALGIFSNQSSERRNARLQERLQQREDSAERRRVAGLVADQFIGSLRALRGLDERYFEELVDEVFLTKSWYERDEPALLRLLGDVTDADVRQGLTDIVTTLGRESSYGKQQTKYHYVESQLLLGLNIAHAYGRGEGLDSESVRALDELRQRRASKPGTEE